MIDILTHAIIVLAKCTALLFIILGFYMAVYTTLGLILYIKDEKKCNKDE